MLRWSFNHKTRQMSLRPKIWRSQEEIRARAICAKHFQGPENDFFSDCVFDAAAVEQIVVNGLSVRASKNDFKLVSTCLEHPLDP